MEAHPVIKSFQFPQSKLVYTLIVCLSANGSSSYRDASAVARLMRLQFASNVRILSDFAYNFDLPDGVDVHILVDKADCLQQIENYVDGLPHAADLLFVISAHGYSSRATTSRMAYELNGRSEYVRLHTQPVYDYELFKALYQKMAPDTRSFCLVDTCHSGTMLDLEYLSRDGGLLFTRSRTPLLRRPISVCISACDDNELAGEDISQFAGWGGKLICQFLDYASSRASIGPLHIPKFHQHVFATFCRQVAQGSRPVLSYNM
jgi:hypothetical protein